MFHMGTGDKERIWYDLIRLVFGSQGSMAKGNVVDLVTAIAVAVGRDGTGKAFLDNIQRVDLGIFYGKMDVHVCIEGSHSRDPFCVLLSKQEV